MKIERMPEQQAESKHNQRRVEKRGTSEKEIKAFIASGIKDQSEIMAHRALSSSPILSFGIAGEIAPLDIAEVLSRVTIEDSYIKKRVRKISENPQGMLEDDVAFATSVALGKAIVAKREGSLSKAEEGLKEFKKTVLAGAEKRIREISKKKVLRMGTALALTLTACSTTITPRTPEATQRIEPVPTEYVPVPTESVPTPTEEVVAKFPEEEINQLQEQLKAQGLETEIVENEEEFILNDISRTKAVEIGVFRLENDQCVFVVIKSNGKEVTYPVSQLGIDEEDNRLVIKDETGRINFKYYPELQRLKQEIEFPYLKLSTESERFNLRIGESMENDIKSIEWNNDIPPLRYQDPETGEIRMLTPQECFDEAVFVAFWSLATTNGLNPGVTLEDIRQGTLIKYKNNEDKEITIDTEKPIEIIMSTNLIRKSRSILLLASVDKFWIEAGNQSEMVIYYTQPAFEFWAGYGVKHKDYVEGTEFLIRNIFYYLTDPKKISARDFQEHPDYWALYPKYFNEFKREHSNTRAIKVLEQLFGNPGDYNLNDFIIFEEEE
jgi:hypothetical protein